jgi:O-antigen/teichoic acid export membrane protein
MGIIERQTVRGSFLSYFGVGLGFLTVGILWPRMLEPEQIGLINFFIALSMILAQGASLGVNSISLRLFPQFRDNQSKHHGYLALGLLILAAGACLVLLYYFLFEASIIENNAEKSGLIATYVYFIVPFTIVTMLFNFFEGLHRVLYNAVIGLFLKEFVFRLLNLILILLYAWLAFSFELFLNVYFIIFSLPALILIIALARSKQFNLKPESRFINRDLGRNLASVGFFGLISGMGTMAISSIDKIMINHFIDLKATGIYSIAFLFGTIVTLPSRPLIKIASTIVAEAWKKDDTHTIKTIYTKSSLNQFIFAGGIFLLIWLNVDFILQLIGEDYMAGRWVILFISLSGVLQMTLGLNGTIIVTSKFYRFQSLFVMILMIAVVATNMIFIPRWGITGAAIASLLSTFLFHLSRIVFLFAKFRMQPFNYRFLIVLALFMLAWLVGSWMEGISHWAVRIGLVTLMVLLVYLVPLMALRVSEDLSNFLSNTWRRFRS